MTRPRMRPTFCVDAPCPPDRMIEAIESRQALEADEIEGRCTRRHAVLRVVGSGRRFWTPCLDLMVERVSEEDDADGARVWGTFSPRPEIWTGFVFAIGTLIVVGTFAAMIGVAQLALGHPPVALAIPVFAGLVGVALYVLALLGQALSLSEMYRLRAFIDDCLRDVGAEGLARTPSVPSPSRST